MGRRTDQPATRRLTQDSLVAQRRLAVRLRQGNLGPARPGHRGRRSPDGRSARAGPEPAGRRGQHGLACCGPTAAATSSLPATTPRRSPGRDGHVPASGQVSSDAQGPADQRPRRPPVRGRGRHGRGGGSVQRPGDPADRADRGDGNSVAVSPDGSKLYVGVGSFQLLAYDVGAGTEVGSSTHEHRRLRREPGRDLGRRLGHGRGRHDASGSGSPRTRTCAGRHGPRGRGRRPGLGARPSAAAPSGSAARTRSSAPTRPPARRWPAPPFPTDDGVVRVLRQHHRREPAATPTPTTRTSRPSSPAWPR